MVNLKSTYHLNHNILLTVQFYLMQVSNYFDFKHLNGKKLRRLLSHKLTQLIRLHSQYCPYVVKNFKYRQ